jgi:hypothetical protein
MDEARPTQCKRMMSKPGLIPWIDTTYLRKMVRVVACSDEQAGIIIGIQIKLDKNG